MKIYATVELTRADGTKEEYTASEGIVTNAYKWLACFGYPELRGDPYLASTADTVCALSPEILCGGLSLFSGTLDCKEYKDSKMTFSDIFRKVAWADNKTTSGGDLRRGLMNWDETKRKYFEWLPVYDFDADRGNCTFQSLCLTHTAAAGLTIYPSKPDVTYNEITHGKLYAPYSTISTDYFKPIQEDPSGDGCTGKQDEIEFYKNKLNSQTLTYIAGTKIITLYIEYRADPIGLDGYYIEEDIADYGYKFDLSRYAGWYNIYEDATNGIARNTVNIEKFKSYAKYVNLGSFSVSEWWYSVVGRHQASPSLGVINDGDDNALIIGDNPPIIKHRVEGDIGRWICQGYYLVTEDFGTIDISYGVLRKLDNLGNIVWSNDLNDISTMLGFEWGDNEDGLWFVSPGFGGKYISLVPYRKNDLTLIFNLETGEYIGYFFKGDWGSAYIGADCIFANKENPIELQLKNKDYSDTICLNPNYFYAKVNFDTPIVKNQGDVMKIKLRLTDEQVIHEEASNE